LLATANELLPDVQLAEQDVDLHYSGVRPLPYVGGATPASITRRHWLAENTAAAMPFFSVIGGKLTTCRSLAEETTALVLGKLGRAVTANSESRPIPGAAEYPADERAQQAYVQQVAARTGFTAAQVQAAWPLYGTRTVEVLTEFAADKSSLAGTDLPTALVRYAARREWVSTLDDLVERRLMLLYHRRLYEGTLRQAAALLTDEGVMAAGQIEAQVTACIERLRVRFGKQVFSGLP